MRTAGEAEEAATGGQKELPVRIQLSSPEEFGSRTDCRRGTVIKRAASRDRSGLAVREKTVHGLFQLGLHPKPPRVFGGADRRILRW